MLAALVKKVPPGGEGFEDVAVQGDEICIMKNSPRPVLEMKWGGVAG